MTVYYFTYWNTFPKGNNDLRIVVTSNKDKIKALHKKYKKLPRVDGVNPIYKKETYLDW